MNCPSRPDDTDGHPDWNQSPHALSSDLTTRADLNGIVNLREQRENDSSLGIDQEDHVWAAPTDQSKSPIQEAERSMDVVNDGDVNSSTGRLRWRLRTAAQQPGVMLRTARRVLIKYVQFVGPGFMIAVAYIDPGNYATDVEAGAATRYGHLFIILMSNLFAIFLQSLCIKLGSVTGLNLAENCREHLPKWVTIILYLFSEAAIIATDIAEVNPRRSSLRGVGLC